MPVEEQQQQQPGHQQQQAGQQEVNVSFAGSGFMGVYHLGVASALLERGAALTALVRAYAGASAGAMTAAMLATAPHRIPEATQFVYSFGRQVRELALGVVTPGFDFMKTLIQDTATRTVLLNRWLSTRRGFVCVSVWTNWDGIEALLPEDAHKRAEGRLHISISSARSGHNRVVSSYGSRQELVQVILASSFIPFYAGLEPVTYDGECWFDGGLTNNLPVLERGRTITVSPFSGQHDICPCDPGAVQLFVRVSRENFRVNVRNALRVARAVLPPPRRTMEGVFRCGFQDATRFLHAEKWDRGPQ